MSFGILFLSLSGVFPSFGWSGVVVLVIGLSLLVVGLLLASLSVVLESGFLVTGVLSVLVGLISVLPVSGTFSLTFLGFSVGFLLVLSSFLGFSLSGFLFLPVVESGVLSLGVGLVLSVLLSLGFLTVFSVSGFLLAFSVSGFLSVFSVSGFLTPFSVSGFLSVFLSAGFSPFGVGLGTGFLSSFLGSLSGILPVFGWFSFLLFSLGLGLLFLSVVSSPLGFCSTGFFSFFSGLSLPPSSVLGVLSLFPSFSVVFVSGFWSGFSLTGVLSVPLSGFSVLPFLLSSLLLDFGLWSVSVFCFASGLSVPFASLSRVSDFLSLLLPVSAVGFLEFGSLFSSESRVEDTWFFVFRLFLINFCVWLRFFSTFIILWLFISSIFRLMLIVINTIIRMVLTIYRTKVLTVNEYGFWFLSGWFIIRGCAWFLINVSSIFAFIISFFEPGCSLAGFLASLSLFLGSGSFGFIVGLLASFDIVNVIIIIIFTVYITEIIAIVGFRFWFWFVCFLTIIWFLFSVTSSDDSSSISSEFMSSCESLSSLLLSSGIFSDGFLVLSTFGFTVLRFLSNISWFVIIVIWFFSGFIRFVIILRWLLASINGFLVFISSEGFLLLSTGFWLFGFSVLSAGLSLFSFGFLVFSFGFSLSSEGFLLLSTGFWLPGFSVLAAGLSLFSFGFLTFSLDGFFLSSAGFLSPVGFSVLPAGLVFLSVGFSSFLLGSSLSLVGFLPLPDGLSSLICGCLLFSDGLVLSSLILLLPVGFSVLAVGLLLLLLGVFLSSTGSWLSVGLSLFSLLSLGFLLFPVVTASGLIVVVLGLSSVTVAGVVAVAVGVFASVAVFGLLLALLLSTSGFLLSSVLGFLSLSDLSVSGFSLLGLSGCLSLGVFVVSGRLLDSVVGVFLFFESSFFSTLFSVVVLLFGFGLTFLESDAFSFSLFLVSGPSFLPTLFSVVGFGLAFLDSVALSSPFFLVTGFFVLSPFSFSLSSLISSSSQSSQLSHSTEPDSSSSIGVTGGLIMSGLTGIFLIGVSPFMIGDMRTESSNKKMPQTLL
ncbi:hypothetical protein SFRURICE_014309 [Spodoptera frugiperda]|nr:hypothetical protein SFRURICE_014309 [Spodoptera frugiperda]